MTTLKYEEQLQKLFANTNDWLKFAEAKNFGLLTLNAAIAFGFTQITFKDGSTVEFVGLYIFLPITFFSFLVATLSLFPILAKIDRGHQLKSWIDKCSNWIDREVPFENIHYYGYLKDLSEIEFQTKFLSKTNSTDPFVDYEKELATQILYNSRIASIKFQLFKIGAFIFCFAAVFSVILLPILLFGKKLLS